MTVREYAKSVDFNVVGKLSRFAKGETYGITNRKQRAYIDDGGNEYYIGKDSACIVTATGYVI